MSGQMQLAADIIEFLNQKIANGEYRNSYRKSLAELDPPFVVSQKHIFRSHNSLSLRKLGARLLRQYFDHEIFKIHYRITNRDRLVLSQKMVTPYYTSPSWYAATNTIGPSTGIPAGKKTISIPIRKIHIGTTLTLFSKEDIFMFKMSGDIETWISNL